MSEARPEDLDRSDAAFPFVHPFELLPLNSLTNWINVSICVASSATIAFILLSTSLEDNLRFCSWNRKLSSTSLVDSAKLCASPIWTNCQVVVMFSSDIVSFQVDEEKIMFKLYLEELKWEFWVKQAKLFFHKSRKVNMRKVKFLVLYSGLVYSLWWVIAYCPAFWPLIRCNYIWSRDRVITCGLAFTITTFDIAH